MTNNEQKKSDLENTLWAELEGSIGTERADTLLQLSSLLSAREEFEQALALIDSAIEAAASVDNDFLLGQGHYFRGLALRRLKRFEDSAQAYLSAASAFQRIDDIPHIARSFTDASWSYELAEQYEVALQHADSAVAAADQQDEAEVTAQAHSQRADVLTLLDRPHEERLASYSVARQAWRNANQPSWVLNTDMQVAEIFVEMEDYQAAANLLRDSLAVAETLDEAQASLIAYRLGRVLRRQEKFVEAIEMQQRPLQFHLAKQSMYELASVYYELAKCEWRLDHADEALSLVAKARAHFDMVGHDGAMQDCDVSRAVWLHSVGRYNEAIAINQQLMETTTGWNRFMAITRMADNHRCKGDYDQALELTRPEAGDDDYAGWSSWFWREAISALTLYALDRKDDAWAIADACLAMDIKAASAFTRATFCEMKGDSYYMDEEADEDAAHDWWARAVAFYLAADMVADAKRLSSEFISGAAEDQAQ